MITSRLDNLTQGIKLGRILIDHANKRENVHININEQRTLLYAGNENKIYYPTPTGLLAHSDDSFVRTIMGPYGSGKSTWAIHEMVRRACAMPAWSSAGRRRSRWAIVRNTSGELQSTTLQTWLAWFGELGDIRKRQKPILTYEHHFNDGLGIVELELLFIALDRPDDIRKLKSLELTGCYLNELSEIPQAAISHMKGRVNRYPSHGMCKEPYWAGIIADTNPPEDDHWIYKDFEEKDLESYRLFKQPPGLIKDDGHWVRNPEADNANNLPIDYYEKLAEGQTEEFVKVFCLGLWGSVGTGKRVYSEFNSDIHAVDEIPANQGDKLHIGWDGGLTPAAIVIQFSPRGQMRILKEYIGLDIGIRAFGEYVLQKLKEDFPYNMIGLSVFDPSGANRDQIIEETSCISELNSIGIKTEAARTNDPAARLGAVRYFLNRMVDGHPGLIIARKACPVLYKGFVKDYVYRRLAVSGEARYRDVPDKTMSSHPHDGLQYIALEFAAEQISKEKQPSTVVDMFNPVMRLF